MPKAKIMKLQRIQKILHSKKATKIVEWEKKTTCRVGENFCKPFISKVLALKIYKKLTNLTNPI